MDFKLICGIIAISLTIVSYLPYIRDIFARRTTPHIYSWLVWSVLQTIGVIAMINDGAHFGALGLAGDAFFCIIIFVLAIRFGTKNITRFDTACLIAAIATTIIYLFQDDPTLAVILISIIDFVAFFPTYRKGYEEPYSETARTFLLSGISHIFALFSLGEYTLITTLYVSSLLLTNSVIVGILVIRRKQLRTINAKAV